MSERANRLPFAAGGALAIAAAMAFGATAPLIHFLGSKLGPFATAALLYTGAFLSAVPALLRRKEGLEARVRRSDAPWLIVIAILGAAVAPTFLAWGLQRTSASVGALLLNGEVVFTALLARLALAERMSVRGTAGLVLICGGAGALGLLHGASVNTTIAGIAAVTFATFAWAGDNVVGRRLADRDPVQVVGAKAILGAVLTWAVALLLREVMPTPAQALGLLACGATGYGLSLRWYLFAQRSIGAARTASIFAIGPFVGAVLGSVLDHQAPGPPILVGAALMAAGIYFHATERHDHWHMHREVEHEHAHDHDDDHHDHEHSEPVAGGHSHWHRHAALTHGHPHAADIHHAHEHESRVRTRGAVGARPICRGVTK